MGVAFCASLAIARPLSRAEISKKLLTLSQYFAIYFSSVTDETNLNFCVTRNKRKELNTKTLAKFQDIDNSFLATDRRFILRNLITEFC